MSGITQVPGSIATRNQKGEATANNMISRLVGNILIWEPVPALKDYRYNRRK